MLRTAGILVSFLLIASSTARDGWGGPREMWVLVVRPSAGDVWRSGYRETVRWAAVPGQTVRCELWRNGRRVAAISPWLENDPGEFTFPLDVKSLEPGGGYTVRVFDEQGFFGQSEEFAVSPARH